ncbi:MAG: hypothetical protein H0U70_05940 [Tatlockia sp.]|nr:hypothetical protein [Tatlockia sp.]
MKSKIKEIQNAQQIIKDSKVLLYDHGFWNLHPKSKFKNFISAFDQTTQTLISADDYNFKIINTNTLESEKIATHKAYRPHFIIFNPRKKIFYCVYDEGLIQEINIETGKSTDIFSMDKHERRTITKIFFSDHFQALILVKEGYKTDFTKIHFLYLSKNLEIWEMNKIYSKFALSADSSYLICWDRTNQLIEIFNFKTRHLERTIECNLDIYSIKIAANNRLIFCAARDRIYSYDLQSGLRKQICTIEDKSIEDFFVTSDNRSLLIYDWQNHLYYFNLNNGNELDKRNFLFSGLFHLDDLSQLLIMINPEGIALVQYKKISDQKEIRLGMALVLLELAAINNDSSFTSLTQDCRFLVYQFCFLIINNSSTKVNFNKSLSGFSLFSSKNYSLTHAQNQALNLDLFLSEKLPNEKIYCGFIDNLSDELRVKKLLKNFKISVELQEQLENLSKQFEHLKINQNAIPAYKLAAMISLLIIFSEQILKPEHEKIQDFFTSLISKFTHKSDLDLRKIKRVPVSLESGVEESLLVPKF